MAGRRPAPAAAGPRSRQTQTASRTSSSPPARSRTRACSRSDLVAALLAVDDGSQDAACGGEVAAEAIALRVGREVALGALLAGRAGEHAGRVEVERVGRGDMVRHDAEARESPVRELGVTALEQLVDHGGLRGRAIGVAGEREIDEERPVELGDLLAVAAALL